LRKIQNNFTQISNKVHCNGQITEKNNKDKYSRVVAICKSVFESWSTKKYKNRTSNGVNMSGKNAGVTSSKIKFCDLKCEHASFPKEEWTLIKQS
jgi:hypothetical protein